MKKYLQIVLYTGLIFISLSRFSFSQSDKFNSINIPKLGGNKFIVNNFIPDPFISSRINSGLGFASSIQTEIPLLKLGDTSNLKIKADITYASGNFEFAYAVKDWASMWINFEGIARIGTNSPSIFVSGITANTSFEVGMLFKIKEFKKSLISSSFHIDNASSTVLNIFEFLNSVLDTNQKINLGIVNNFNPLTGTVDLRFAYAPSNQWSIMAYTAGGYGEVVQVDSIVNSFFYSFGASANYNLDVKTKIPFGVGVGFKLNSKSPTLDYSKKTTQALMLAINLHRK